MGKHRESWKRWEKDLRKKPKEPGGCCLIQMIAVVLLTILAYVLFHWLWVDMRHSYLDRIDALFTGENEVEASELIAYGEDEQQVLTVHRASDAQGPQPVIVWFHGGGWENGEPESYGFIGRNFAPEGFVVVSAGYRLLPDGKYPAMLADSAAALRWTARNIGEYGGDPERIYLMGHSAGAYNAVMLALDRRWTRRLRLPDNTIDGVIGLAGPYDFLPLDGENVENAFGDADPIERTQPIAFARKGAPPMLLATGSRDSSVEPRNSEALAKALTEKGSPAEALVLDHFGHATLLMALAEPAKRANNSVTEAVLTFLREQEAAADRKQARTERRAREKAEAESRAGEETADEGEADAEGQDAPSGRDGAGGETQGREPSATVQPADS